MSVQQQLHNRLWATSSNYEEVLPYLNNENYSVSNTYHANGLFDQYYIHII